MLAEKTKEEKVTKSKNKKNNKNKKSLKARLIGYGVLVVILAVGIIILQGLNVKPKTDTEYLNALVKESSELTTAKLNYTGMTEFKDKGVKFINRADFTMVYKATLRAGVDVKSINITADDDNQIIYVTIPKATIQDIKVKPGSIKYYDEEVTLFNTDEKEDANKAQELAEKEALKEAKNMGILKLADQQAEALIKGILANAIPEGYQIKIKK